MFNRKLIVQAATKKSADNENAFFIFIIGLRSFNAKSEYLVKSLMSDKKHQPRLILLQNCTCKLWMVSQNTCRWAWQWHNSYLPFSLIIKNKRNTFANSFPVKVEKLIKYQAWIEERLDQVMLYRYYWTAVSSLLGLICSRLSM